MSTQNQTAQAVQAALDAQPKWYKSKSTYINLLQGIVWIVGVATPLLTTAPEWVALLIGGVGMFAASALSKLTPGELTPSMPGRIASYAPPAPAPVELPETAHNNDVEQQRAPAQPEPDTTGGRHRLPDDQPAGSTVVTADTAAAPDYEAYMERNGAL